MVVESLMSDCANAMWSALAASAGRQIVGPAAPDSTRTTASMDVTHGPKGATLTEVGYAHNKRERGRSMGCKRDCCCTRAGNFREWECLGKHSVNLWVTFSLAVFLA